ncbi:MAG: hypothetical protein JWP91_690 [Fibrobacteres bacterium]|nr:hypothetical protein [Fibrobacterota bacterium]
MNTTSRHRRVLAVLAGAATASALALAACIQGPWDYYPEDPPVFRGLYVYGYVISGRPVQNLCFERILDVKEEATQAFAFYDSAVVTVTGSFGGSVRSQTLTAVVDTPDCFKGDPALLVERGSAYDLSARIQWDSAGKRVTTLATATAKVPASFSIHRTAAAPSFAKTGGIPSNIFTLEFLAALPPNVREIMAREYGDTLTKIQKDTAALRKYITANGPAMQKRLIGLLEKDKFTYTEGDTLFYLNGALNTLSHYFSSDRSADVNSVLITQRFERNSERPETRFDSPVGIKPDSGQYYFPGDIRRLLIYPDAKGDKGAGGLRDYNLLDSLGVVNVFFHTLRNRLYFYGFEQAYYAYLSTVTETQGGGGGDADPRIKPKYNVTGAAGIFAGAIPDSFDVFIKVDSLTKAYSLPAVHGRFCHKDGWFDSKDCREYYRPYCSERNWQPADCLQDALEACMLADLKGDTALKARCTPMADSARKDTAMVRRAENRFCVQNDFPAGAEVCAAPKAQCLETRGVNDCKRNLWDYCLDNAWRPEQCGPGLAGYCNDKPRLSETLCRNADAWCAEPGNAGSPLCR